MNDLRRLHGKKFLLSFLCGWVFLKEKKMSQKLNYLRVSDPGPTTEYMQMLQRDFGYMDFSDAAQIQLSAAEKEELEQKISKASDRVLRSNASENVSQGINYLECNE